MIRAARLLIRTVGAFASALVFISGCRDIASFSSGSGSFEGAVIQGDFVRTGIAAETRVCLTLDTDHLQDSPGLVSSSDGRFHLEPMRPIPQIWHDPLSTLSFGEGREKNLVYIATPSSARVDGGGGGSAAPETGDVFVVVSLMTTGGVEVRLLRGAPRAPAPDSGDSSPPPGGPNLFAVFTLSRQNGPCTY